MHIIEPWTIYWISRLDAILGIAVAGALFIIGVVVIDMISYLSESKHYLLPSKASRAAAIVGMIFFIAIGVALPDKATAIQMVLADKLTYDAVEDTYEKLTETADRIVKMMKED